LIGGKLKKMKKANYWYKGYIIWTKKNDQNVGIAKEHSEKEIFLFNKIQYAESKDIIIIDELEEFESEYDNKDSNNNKDNNDDYILDNQKNYF